MFTHRRTNARTPDRPVYYKLTFEPSAQWARFPCATDQKSWKSVNWFQRRRFLNFLPYMDKEAIWSRDQHYINIFSFPCTKNASMRNLVKKVMWFLKKTSFDFDM